MAKKNRSTLKRYFSEGALPTADQFADLIDSNLNMVSEGFDKSPEQGFEVSLIGDHDKLISFFRNTADQQAVWSISYDRDTDRLRFVKPGKAEAPPVLTLDSGGRVGVNTERPQWNLDVAGVLAVEGRIGANPGLNKTVPADGEWHDITPSLSGCQGFEVMAGVGHKGTGKYALMQAVALNAFNPSGWIFNLFRRKNRIRVNQSYYLSRGHRIKLRWFGKTQDYRLQMRTSCDYGDGIRIRFYLTRLWFDPAMQESWGEADDAQPDQAPSED